MCLVRSSTHWSPYLSPMCHTDVVCGHRQLGKCNHAPNCSSIMKVILITSLYKGTCASHHDNHHCRGHRHKSFHFTLFEHAWNHKQNIICHTETTTPLWSFFVLQDYLTTKAKKSSKQLGTTKGTSITSSLDGLSRIWVAKLTLCLNDDKGSSNVRLGNSHKKIVSIETLLKGS